MTRVEFVDYVMNSSCVSYLISGDKQCVAVVFITNIFNMQRDNKLRTVLVNFRNDSEFRM